MADQHGKPIEWVGSTLKDLRSCPEHVRGAFGYALHLAQHGERHPDAVVMKGKLRGVTEVRVDEDGDTYRTMYTATFAGVVYVLNVFQKKSTRGISTPHRKLELTVDRLKVARAHHQKHYRDKNS